MINAIIEMNEALLLHTGVRTHRVLVSPRIFDALEIETTDNGQRHAYVPVGPAALTGHRAIVVGGDITIQEAPVSGIRFVHQEWDWSTSCMTTR